MRDAPHTGDFLTNPGNLAAPDSPAPLVSTFIFLVFRAWTTRAMSSAEIRIVCARGLVDRSVYTCASDLL